VVTDPTPQDETGRQPMPELDHVAPAAEDGAIEDLRALLLRADRQQLADLQARLADVEQRVGDADAMIAAITPLLSEMIRRSIRDAREQMIEALYPIIGQVVMRAVSEAIRDLARSVDERMRHALQPGAYFQRLRARLHGVDAGQFILREALPFHVQEVFLIHRASGLLLLHVGRDLLAAGSANAGDADIVGAMLVAIRDFASDVLHRSVPGQEGEETLDEIQFGNRAIIIEAAQLAYLAVVAQGVPPTGFRAEMRQRLIKFQTTYAERLAYYQGDATPLVGGKPLLQGLLEGEP
jgi:hypothetical protein